MNTTMTNSDYIWAVHHVKQKEYFRLKKEVERRKKELCFLLRLLSSVDDNHDAMVASKFPKGEW